MAVSESLDEARATAFNRLSERGRTLYSDKRLDMARSTRTSFPLSMGAPTRELAAPPLTAWPAAAEGLDSSLASSSSSSCAGVVKAPQKRVRSKLQPRLRALDVRREKAARAASAPRGTTDLGVRAAAPAHPESAADNH